MYVVRRSTYLYYNFGIMYMVLLRSGIKNLVNRSCICYLAFPITESYLPAKAFQIYESSAKIILCQIKLHKYCVYIVIDPNTDYLRNSSVIEILNIGTTIMTHATEDIFI